MVSGRSRGSLRPSEFPARAQQNVSMPDAAGRSIERVMFLWVLLLWRFLAVVSGRHLGVRFRCGFFRTRGPVIPRLDVVTVDGATRFFYFRQSLNAISPITRKTGKSLRRRDGGGPMKPY